MFRMNRQKLFYLVFSLIMAILLAAYVDGTTPSKTTKVSDTKQNVAGIVGIGMQKTITTTVPVQLSGIDMNEYIVTGVPEMLDVKLTGSSALVTTAVNTKNFQVYANLKGLSEGPHKITLKVSGLNKDLAYKLSQETVDVNIYRRAVKNFDVQTTYNKTAIAAGYEVGDVTSSVTSAQVIGSPKAVASVAKVVANVQLDSNVKSTISKKVNLQAIDSDGNVVNVTISPAEAYVKIPVTAGKGTKQIPINLKPTNGDSSRFSVTADVNEARISGDAEQISRIKSIDVPVDLSNINVETMQNVKLPVPDGVSIDPGSIVVTITPNAS